MSESSGWSFLVGMDAIPANPGPLAFGRWLDRHGCGPAPLVGVHIIEHGAELKRTAPQIRGRLHAIASQALETCVVADGARGSFARVEIHDGGTVEAELGRLITEHRPRALIVGRRARRDGKGVIRLGRTTRRLLRELTVPTFVVPPDLTAADIGAGPIMVAVDPGDPADAHLHFALELAGAIGREIALVHVIRDQSAMLTTQFDPTAFVEVYRRHHAYARDAMNRWVMAHDLVRVPVSVLEGPIIEGILHAATRENVCMVLCGSRCLGLRERVFASSHASELAGRAGIAVGVSAPAETTPTEVT